MLRTTSTWHVRTRKYRFISVSDVVDPQNFNGQQARFSYLICVPIYMNMKP